MEKSFRMELAGRPLIVKQEKWRSRQVVQFWSGTVKPWFL